LPGMTETGLGTETTAAAVERLAERLYWNMQRLDPDIDAPDWAGLNVREKRFYRLLVYDLGLVEVHRELMTAEQR
jgi:hypothetical protein